MHPVGKIVCTPADEISLVKSLYISLGVWNCIEWLNEIKIIKLIVKQE